MDFTFDYCLNKLKEEYMSYSNSYLFCLKRYGKTAIVTQTLLKNVISGVNKYLTLKKIISNYKTYEGILLRIYNARIAMNEQSVIDQLKNIDNLFKEENFN